MVKTTKRQQNDKTTTTNNKKPVVYTPYTSFKNYILSFLKSNEKRQYTLNELKQNYEVETNKKASLRSYQRYIKKLEIEGIINIKRQEQSYISFNNAYIPYERSNERDKTTIKHGKKISQNNKKTAKVVDRLFFTTTTKRIHSAHSIRFSIGYNGEQPKDDADKVLPIGRINRKYPNKKRSVQCIYKYKGFTIQIYKKRMQIYIHNPQGISTKEQLNNAKNICFKAVMVFCKEHNIDIEEKYLLKTIGSHHVVEDRKLNNYLKPIYKKYSKEIFERINSKYGDKSHPNKVEHSGDTGEQVANGLEYMVLKLPEVMEKHVEIEEKYYNAIGMYNKNIEKHLKVMDKISDSVESSGKANTEISRSLKKLTKLMKKQQEGDEE